ncbi:mannosyl-oligosaccharide alpha-1,2-mannosidase [Capronia epimyces CBS 606.96]|uniref:alpha-1,2-Mannosidase n=1 Tax=Capronia epimyces CBS 606.96 TaxID=1182542 RepID=W9YR62_9EURO|nr:mannosyl-oligosaccharide alpha-1,2-mannosidase [Capronia epimyces CBS 606.96]EXJ84764.1 mannosyl-oligosaccharide alpha-1,2-mannosidase [Capronia epimyces CBS 606.96]
MVVRKKRLAVFVAVVACILLFLTWHLPVTDQSNQTQHEASVIDGRNAGHEEAPQPHGAKDGAFAPSIGATSGAQQQRPPQKQLLLHPISSFVPLPTAATTIPRIQHEFEPESATARETRLARLHSIREAMVHSWNGYRSKAWRMDELAPVTGGYRTTFGGWAATLVDALDTLWLMGLKEEFEEAVEAVAGIDFDIPAQLPINVFETTIRYLGGLLGAYDASDGKYPVLLHKAKEVGDMLYVAFDTPNHMPVLHWSKIGVEAAPGQALIAELGSLSLEFTRLTQLTGDPKFYDAVQRITSCLEDQQDQTKMPGLFPHSVNARDCYFGDGVTFSIGGSADSVYEYLPKQHQLLRGATEQYKKLYQNAMGPVKKSILFKPMTPQNEDILMAGTLKAFTPGQVQFEPQMQHLACFAGGMFALGARLFGPSADLDVAQKLVRGCIWAYNQTTTGIMPETLTVVPCPDDDWQCTWDEKIWAKDVLRRNTNDESPDDRDLPEEERLRQKADRLRLPKGISAIASRGYGLRPEAIESIFVLYRITGDEELREAAWTMFEAITKRTRTDLGFSSIEDVTKVNSWKVDKMESFWMAETLKYFWLLFEDPSIVSLDEFVFNTEAHPFRWQI